LKIESPALLIELHRQNFGGQAGYWKKLELFTKKTPMLISKKIARAGREGKGFQGKGIPAPPSLPPPQFFVFRFAKNVVCPLLFLIFGIVL